MTTPNRVATVSKTDHTIGNGRQAHGLTIHSGGNDNEKVGLLGITANKNSRKKRHYCACFEH